MAPKEQKKTIPRVDEAIAAVQYIGARSVNARGPESTARNVEHELSKSEGTILHESLLQEFFRGMRIPKDILRDYIYLAREGRQGEWVLRIEDSLPRVARKMFRARFEKECLNVVVPCYDCQVATQRYQETYRKLDTPPPTR